MNPLENTTVQFSFCTLPSTTGSSSFARANTRIFKYKQTPKLPVRASDFKGYKRPIYITEHLSQDGNDSRLIKRLASPCC